MVPTENLPYLPFDIIIIILSMLPAETLVRFMAVCREWRDLITDADFILKHLQISTSRGSNYILCCPKLYTPGRSFRLLTDKSHVKVFEREIQFDFHDNLCTSIWSSNGLELLTGGFRQNGSVLHLYNPFIQKYKSIPTTTLHVNDVFGFGYHSEANDYKIVKIVYDVFYEYDEDNNVEIVIDNVEVEVYSLSTDSWTRLDAGSFPWDIPVDTSTAVVNDCIHWIARTSDSLILSFDLGRQVFEPIELPDYGFVGAGYCEQVVVCKDKLSYMAVHSDGLDHFCSLCIMQEYGVFESWSWLFTVVMEDRLIGYGPDITFTKHDEFIKMDENQVVLVYNFLTHERQNFEFNVDHRLDFLPLTNSLTLLETRRVE